MSTLADNSKVQLKYWIKSPSGVNLSVLLNKAYPVQNFQEIIKNWNNSDGLSPDNFRFLH